MVMKRSSEAFGITSCLPKKIMAIAMTKFNNLDRVHNYVGSKMIEVFGMRSVCGFYDFP